MNNTITPQHFQFAIKTPIYILQVSTGESFLLYKKEMLIKKFVKDSIQPRSSLQLQQEENKIITADLTASRPYSKIKGIFETKKQKQDPKPANTPSNNNPPEVVPPEAKIQGNNQTASSMQTIRFASKASKVQEEEKKMNAIDLNEFSKWILPKPKKQSKKMINDSLTSVILSLSGQRNQIFLDILSKVDQAHSVQGFKNLVKDKLTQQSENLTIEVAKLTSLDIGYSEISSKIIGNIINQSDLLCNKLDNDQNISNNIKDLCDTIISKGVPNPSKRAISRVFFINHIYYFLDITL